MTVTRQAVAPSKVTAAPVSALLQRKCACGNHTVMGGECATCRQQRLAALQRTASQPTASNAVPAIVHDVLRSPGQPLDATTRAFMEPRFGRDLSGVRVHSDSLAAESARGVNALVYTVGDHIVFGSAQYAPQTVPGRRLLAHELTHVVQQGINGSARPQYAKAVSHPADAAEIEAEATAERVMCGAPVQVRQPASAVVQGIGIGAAIAIGLGAAVGGLGIAALAGVFGGRRRWSISQANTDGVGSGNYESDVTVTFNPDKDTMNCSEIAFVQAVRRVDATSGASLEDRPIYTERLTSTGWKVDRLLQRQYGWYGYNNNGRPSGTVSPGRSPRPLQAATLRDTPAHNRPNSLWQFETCAICKSGTDANLVYGCYTWGFSADADNHLTSLPNRETATPSSEFAETIRLWNVQAAGPEAARNAPGQQPLGPFRNRSSAPGSP